MLTMLGSPSGWEFHGTLENRPPCYRAERSWRRQVAPFQHPTLIEWRNRIGATKTMQALPCGERDFSPHLDYVDNLGGMRPKTQLPPPAPHPPSSSTRVYIQFPLRLTVSRPSEVKLFISLLHLSLYREVRKSNTDGFVSMRDQRHEAKLVQLGGPHSRPLSFSLMTSVSI